MKERFGKLSILQVGHELVIGHRGLTKRFFSVKKGRTKKKKREKQTENKNEKDKTKGYFPACNVPQHNGAVVVVDGSHDRDVVDNLEAVHWSVDQLGQLRFRTLD